METLPEPPEPEPVKYRLTPTDQAIQSLMRRDMTREENEDLIWLLV